MLIRYKVCGSNLTNSEITLTNVDDEEDVKNVTIYNCELDFCSEFEYDEYPFVLDAQEAMKDGAPLLHEKYPNNILAATHINNGNYDAEAAVKARENGATVWQIDELKETLK